jgi:simple sugar transport system ATP-binding protein
VGERQRVEILKALYRGARILILDEPTSVLTPQESEALFATLGQMVAQGLSIIFISHKLGEVLRVSHRVAVLRGGKLVAEAPAAGTSQEQLALWMVGHAVSTTQRHPASATGVPVCTLNAVATVGGGRDRLHGVSLELRAGEIVAIAGVSGNGQLALAELLCGTRRASQGTLTFLGKPLPAAPAWLVSQGVARIPEDRHGVGLIGDLSVWENAVSERLRSPALSRLGWVRRRTAQAHAARIIREFDVRGGGLHAAARSLSGGNMQKLILGRALVSPDTAGKPMPASPRLIIAHQPTWGLDLGAVAYVQQQLIAARDAGAAVLLISDDLDEVLALGDRVAVMHAGHITDALPAEAWTRESVGLAMAGVPSVRVESVEAACPERGRREPVEAAATLTTGSGQTVETDQSRAARSSPP